MSSSIKKLIVVDGGEGAGKGELLKRIKTQFPNVVVTREPGGTEYAESIRDIVLSGLGKCTSPFTQLLAVMSARVDHVEKLIRPSLESGKDVVTDRFDISSYAYQVAHDRSLHTLFYELRNKILGLGTAAIIPIYLYLDVEPEIGLTRRSHDTTQTRNHFDDKPVSYHEIVRSGYLEFIRDLPDGQGFIVNAKQPLEAVMTEALDCIRKLIG